MHEIKIPVQELLLKMGGEGLIREEGGYHCSTMIMIKQVWLLHLIGILGGLGCT